MPAKGLSKRRLKRQLRYAAQGVAIGLIASVALISGTIVIVRWIIGEQVSQKLTFGCAFFTLVLIVMIYRFWHVKRKSGESRRSEADGAVTELSASDKTDKTKSA
jgi:amino acid permease